MAMLKAAEAHGSDGPGAGGDEVAERVGCVIAADAVVVGIDFEDIFRAGGVALEGGQAINEPGAAAVDKEGGRDAGGRVAQTLTRAKRRWRRVSKFSRLDLPTLRRRRQLRPGRRWQSSAPIWARSQWVLPPPRAPP